MTGGVDPLVQVFLNKLATDGGAPIETMTPAKARGVLEEAQSSVLLTLPPADVSEKTIMGGIRLTIVRPVSVTLTGGGKKKVLPAFMFFHGGGWVLGDFSTHERFVRDLVVQSGAVAVFVNYTPSPEAGYGVAVQEAFEATRWVSEHGAEIGVDGRRLAVAGNSVGGNMATVVALMAKDAGAPRLCLQVLFWPVTDCKFDTPSYKRYGQGHFLTTNMMKWFWDNYTVDTAERRDIHASPLRASVTQLAGLPPTLVQTAECDVLRDEGEAYSRKLSSAGVAVTSVRYNGMIHDFSLLNAIAHVPAVRSSLEQAGAMLKKHLARAPLIKKTLSKTPRLRIGGASDYARSH